VREELFVSRACGFKTNYTLDPQTPYVHTDAATDQKWIQYIAVKNVLSLTKMKHILKYIFSICQFIFFIAQAQETTTLKM
jgi:hypothetical protein